MLLQSSLRLFRLVLGMTVLLLPLLTGCSDDSSTEPEVDPPVFVYVDIANGSPEGDGTQADPLAGIQEGIDLAVDLGGDVRVAQGLYLVNSSQGTSIRLDPAVSLYGGYLNDDGAWTRNADTYATIIRDVSMSGGDWADSRAAVVCRADTSGASSNALEGFRLEAGDGDGYAAAVFILEGATVTIRDCEIMIGAAERGYGIKNTSSDRESTAVVTIEDCHISGGAGGFEIVGIYVSRSNLVLLDTVVTGLSGTSRTFGVDCGYGDVLISGCTVEAGTAGQRTYGLYLNEAYRLVVTGCTVHGGSGGAGSIAIAAMDTEEDGEISNNLVDAGAGTQSVAFEMGWVEVNPSVDNNVFTATGGTDRYGIYERDNVSDPVSFTGNTFSAKLLSAPGDGVFYRDFSNNTTTDFSTIEEVNQLDENGFNPAGTVHDNTLGSR